jgi:hypothetical protein
MWVQCPVIFGGDLVAVDDDFDVDELVEVDALVSLTWLTAAGLDLDFATSWLTDMAWWATVAAPAELNPMPSPTPIAAALIESAATALRLRCLMSFSFCWLSGRP